MVGMDRRDFLTTDLAAAATALRAGALVAFPTETVYGLGADADNAAAVSRIYAVKGRPVDHPLIVHLPTADALDAWAVDIPAYARLLAAVCWPGPLTLVLPRAAHVGDDVTGGQPTVGLRVPAHPIALQLLAAFGGGIAAPSANRFGRVSPTDAFHVLEDLGDALDPGRDLVIDGGPCLVGVESTIVDCTGERPRMLRAGGVAAGEVAVITGLDVESADSSVRAPGTLAAHYAPAARVVVSDEGGVEDAVRDAASPTGLLAPVEVDTPEGADRLGRPKDATGYARTLYAALREADARQLAVVVAVPPRGEGLAAAVRDRLARAAASHL